MTGVRRIALYTAGALALAGTLALLYRPGYERRRQMEAAVRAAEAEHQRLEAEQTELAARVDRLTHDPLELEREARQQLGLVRPGEVIYKFPQEDAP